MRYTSNKRLNEFLHLLESLGWRIEQNRHVKIYSPLGQLFTCSSSPSTDYATEELQRDLRRYGKNKHEIDLVFETLNNKTKTEVKMNPQPSKPFNQPTIVTVPPKTVSLASSQATTNEVIFPAHYDKSKPQHVRLAEMIKELKITESKSYRDVGLILTKMGYCTSYGHDVLGTTVSKFMIESGMRLQKEHKKGSASKAAPIFSPPENKTQRSLNNDIRTIAKSNLDFEFQNFLIGVLIKHQ